MSFSPTQQQALAQLFPATDPQLDGLDCYVVGGAVRDALLGLPAGDRDWVVVGATPEQLAQRGFIPVGGDFPVFLHPRTKEEFALARTERKSGRGYQGFTFYTGVDVSLDDDLCRRDLTINAMALSASGQLHDPLNGYQDLKDRRLRHIGQAFVEDPVRLLRLARFAARFADFAIADTTMELAQQLVQNGEVDALVPERVWQELHKGLGTADPMRMIQVLQDCGALARVIPGLIINSAVGAAMRCAVEQSLNTESLFALLCHQSPDPETIATHLRAPTAYKDLARLLPLFLTDSASADQNDAQSLAALLQRCDVLRRAARFDLLVQTASCATPTDLKPWLTYATAFRAVDAGAIAQKYQAKSQTADIANAVWDARVAAVAAVLIS